MVDDQIVIGSLELDSTPRVLQGSWFQRAERSHVDGTATIYDVSGPHSLQMEVHYIELENGARWVMAGESYVGPQWIHTQINNRLRMSVNIKDGVPMFDLTLPTPGVRNKDSYTSSRASRDELAALLPDFQDMLLGMGGVDIDTREELFDDASTRKGFLSITLEDTDCLAPLVGYCLTRLLGLIKAYEESVAAGEIEEEFSHLAGGGGASGAQLDSTAALIPQGETDEVEFKSAIWYNTDRAQHDPNYVPKKESMITDHIIKTVAAFLNASGGTLFIGVADDGTSLGLDHDMQLVGRKDLDGLENAVNTLLIDALDKAVVAAKVKTTFPVYRGKAICRVDVKQANAYVLAKISDNPEAFYVRVGNQSIPMSMQTAFSYINTHNWNID